MFEYLDKFVAYGRIVFKTSAAYRLQFMASVIISPLILLLYYAIWQAVYANTPGDEILGYTFTGMVTYYVVGMLINHMIFNMVGNELQEKVTYGDLIQDLLKPISIFQQFFSMTVADRAYAFLVEVLPVGIIAVLLFKIPLPDLSYMAIFIISVMLAFLINFMIGYGMGLVAFWVSKIESLQWLMFFFIRFLSGEFIPLEFFGPVLFTISKFLPFYYIRYGPIQIFLEKISLQEAVILVLIQIVWITISYLGIRIVWKRALQKFGAQGG